jgi:hypothetical protein
MGEFFIEFVGTLLALTLLSKIGVNIMHGFALVVVIVVIAKLLGL